MSESLADRLKRLATRRTPPPDAEQTEREAHGRAEAFISGYAQPEFEKLQARLKSLVDETNPALSDLPKYQFSANGMVQQGNYCVMLYFDKPIPDRSFNRLLVSFGPHPQETHFLTEPPESRRFELYAGCNNAIDEIRWMGDFGDLSTNQLAEVMLESLTRYYLDYWPT